MCANHHPLALHVCSSMDWKKNQGSQDETESLVPHEGELRVMLSKQKGCFWQDKYKKKDSSLLGLCLILEEMKLLLTLWGGETPQNMKIWGVLYSNKILDKPPEWEFEGEGSLSLFLCFSSDGMME